MNAVSRHCLPGDYAERSIPSAERSSAHSLRRSPAGSDRERDARSARATRGGRRRSRSRCRRSNTSHPVIVLSGFSATMLAPDVLALGAARYIEKGIYPDTIAAMIEEVATPLPRPRASLRLPRERRDASRTAATATDTRYGSRRVSRRAPAPPWHRTRLYAWAFALVALLVIVIALAVANTRHVKLSWIVGTSHASLVWIILVAAVLGWLLGITTSVIFRVRTDADAQAITPLCARPRFPSAAAKRTGRDVVRQSSDLQALSGVIPEHCPADRLVARQQSLRIGLWRRSTHDRPVSQGETEQWLHEPGFGSVVADALPRPSGTCQPVIQRPVVVSRRWSTGSSPVPPTQRSPR